MGIIGTRPETGVRIAVERPHAGGPPWQYRGTVATPDADFPASATIHQGGDVDVELGPDAPPDLKGKIRLILRAIQKHAEGDGVPPARKIVRWRSETGR